MDQKHRLAGFKALLESHKTNAYYLAEPDGNLRLWRDLSAEGRLESIARDAASYDVPFEQFAQAVRQSIDRDAIEEAALRLALRSGRELYDLEKLFPDDGRTETPPSLAERVRELLNGNSLEREPPAVGSATTVLFHEFPLGQTAADAPWPGLQDLRRILKAMTHAPAAETPKNKDIDRER